MTLALEERT